MRKLTSKLISEALAHIGRKGGESGTGKAKIRGNSEYYRNIRRKRKSYPAKQA
jgi:hypothetical protein